MYDLILKNARIPEGDVTVSTNILVKDEKIVGFVDTLDGVDATEVIDAQDNLVFPGFIDPHTHFMYHGFNHRENFLTGSAAALRGGVTTVVDMPCCSVPSVRNLEQFHLKNDMASPQAMVDYAFWGGVTGEDVREGWTDEIVDVQTEAGVVAFKAYMTPSVPTYPRVTDPELYEAMKSVARTGLPLGIHAENFAMCDFNVEKLQKEGRMDAPAWGEARSELAEKVAIELGISFAEDLGARLHIVHMSTGVGARLVKEAKMRGINVTSETCPHYLILNGEEALTKHGAKAKIAPPLREDKDIAGLWKGLQDGSVDFMGTDHAPYELESEKIKEGMNIWTAFPGIPGVETMAPFIISEGLNKGRLTLSQTVDVLSRNAAIHYGIYPKKGDIMIGADADFAIVDLNKEWTIDPKEEASMSGYNPLEGIKLKGRVIQTILRGQTVFIDEEESSLSKLSDDQLKELVHEYPSDIKEKYPEQYEAHNGFLSKNWENSYRKQHPEKINEDIRSIKGVKAQPGYGQLVKRQSIQKLPRKILF